MERQNKSVEPTGGLFSLFQYHTSGVGETSEEQEGRVQIQAGPVTLEGELNIPQSAHGLVVFVHSGSIGCRMSPRSRLFARELREAGLGTLLFDLLTPEEEETDARAHHLRYDIGLLARRTIGVVDWISQHGLARGLSFGLFGATTGAAAALITAAERPDHIGAVVCRGGRPDLAAAAIDRIQAPVLFLAAQQDQINFETNRLAHQQISTRKPGKSEICIVPGAGPFFEEPTAADFVLRQAVDWFRAHLEDTPRNMEKVNKG
jgi:dienelactone hydrolase